MTFYRVDYRSENILSLGFSFHTSRVKAAQALTKRVRLTRDYDARVSKEESTTQPVTITPTKAGIVEALNRLANHPDNG